MVRGRFLVKVRRKRVVAGRKQYSPKERQRLVDDFELELLVPKGTGFGGLFVLVELDALGLLSLLLLAVVLIQLDAAVGLNLFLVLIPG